MRFDQWWNLSLRGNWWNQMWRSLRIAIARAKKSNSHSIWPGNGNVAAGLGTCSHTKERIKPGTKKDVGKKLLVEMGKLTILPGRETAAEIRKPRLLVVYKSRGHWYPIQAFREGLVGSKFRKGPSTWIHFMSFLCFSVLLCKAWNCLTFFWVIEIGISPTFMDEYSITRMAFNFSLVSVCTSQRT